MHRATGAQGLSSGFLHGRARVSLGRAFFREAARVRAPRRSGRAAAGFLEHRRIGATLAMRLGDVAQPVSTRVQLAEIMRKECGIGVCRHPA